LCSINVERTTSIERMGDAMQPFDLSALAAERRVARERQAWSERFRRRSKAEDESARTAPRRCAHAAKPVSPPAA
jgi:hypothetical protein